MKYFFRVVIGSALAGALAAACTVTVDESTHHGTNDRDDQVVNDDGFICGEFCGRLVACGGLAAVQFESCLGECTEAAVIDPEMTRDGCLCVLEDTCRPFSEYDCHGAPLPKGGGGAGGAGQAGSGGRGDGSAGGGSGGSGGAVVECARNHDCAAGEDCIDGACRTRCDLSCQCPLGEICAGGYCSREMPPPPSCGADCDCAAGQRCVEGVCEQ